MDLYVVQIDPGTLRRKQGQELVQELSSIVQSAKLEYEGPIELGTADYSIYGKLAGLGLPIRALWHELDPQTDMELYREAQEFTQDLVQRLGGQADLLFKGINLLDILLFESTLYTCRTILWVRQATLTRKKRPGVLVLLSSLPLVSSESMSSELPVLKVIQVRERKGKRVVIGLLRQGLQLFRRIVSRARFATMEWDAIPSIRDGKNRVLFVVVDSRKLYDNAEPLVSVLKELQRHHDLVPFVAVENSITEEYLKERGFECIKYAFYYSSETESHWSGAEPIFKKKAMELIQQYGPGTVRGLMVSAFLQRYVNRSTLSQIYSHIIWLEEVFQRFQPDVAVIMFTYSFLGKVAARIAKIRGVPTLGVNFGTSYGLQYDFGLFDSTDFIGGPCESFRQALATIGVNLDRYISIGNPRFDAIPTHDPVRDSEYVRRVFGVSAQAKIFLVAGHLVSPGTSEWVRALVRQLKKLDPTTFALIIRPHPDESSQEYERILREEKLVSAVISKDVPLFTLLSASDIVFTSVSGTGTEAVLFNKPLICINLTGIPYSVRYDEEGVALPVEREEDILPTIHKVLGDDHIRRELERGRKRFQPLYAEPDGRSSERFVGAIRQVISRSKNDLKETSKS